MQLQAAPNEPQATPKPVQATEAPAAFPLSVLGPYRTGQRQLTLEDPGRDHREVSVTVWYPALPPGDDTGSPVITDAEPDFDGAPYPLILSSTKLARIFAPYLVTHGFTWASVDKIDYYMAWNAELVRQPRDLLFALDQVAASPPAGLEGMIDADHAGAFGYSFDGYNALALSGARIDPVFYQRQCTLAPSMEPALGPFWIDYYCSMSGGWDGLAAEAGDMIATGGDGLWQPITDERIRAVMPMAPEGAWLFGERGLAAVNRPTLVIGATRDVDCDYGREAVYIFEHLGTSDKTMMTFVGQDHYMVFQPEMVARMAHFAVAFFGTQLQGRADLAWYYSPDFVAQYDDLAWGPYGGG